MYTGASPAFEESFASFSVYPSICQITYECAMSDQSSKDLCNVSGAKTTTTFDQTTADYYLSSINMQYYPPGPYEFTITGRVGSQTAEFTWTLTLVDPCPSSISLKQPMPFEDVEHALREPKKDNFWSLDDLIQFDTQVNCGETFVTFIYGGDKEGQAFDSALFNDYRDDQNSFQVLETESISAVGVYQLTYEVQLESYDVTLRQSEVFTVTITDPCETPNSVTPSVVSRQEYIASTPALESTIPAFTIEPSWCEIEYSVSAPNLDEEIVFFDPETRNITVYAADNLFM